MDLWLSLGKHDFSVFLPGAGCHRILGRKRLESPFGTLADVFWDGFGGSLQRSSDGLSTDDCLCGDLPVGDMGSHTCSIRHVDETSGLNFTF